MGSLKDDAADTAAEGFPGAPPCRGWTPHGAACAACRPILASLPAPLSSQPNDNINNINNNSSCRGVTSDGAGRVPSASPPASSSLELAPRRGGRDACPLHGREGLQLTLFCMRCRERLCYRCAYEGHREHTALPLSAAQDKAKETIDCRKRLVEKRVELVRQSRDRAEQRHAEAMARLSAELGRLRDLVARRGAAAAAELGRVRLGRLATLQMRQGGLEEEWGRLDSIAKTREQRAFLQAFSTLSEPVFQEENDKWDDEDGDDGGLRSLEPLRAWLAGQKTPGHGDPRRVGPPCSPPAPGLPPRNQPMMDGTRIRQSRAHAPCVAPPDPHRHRHHHHHHDHSNHHHHHNERRQMQRFPAITATSTDGGVFDFCLDPGSASPGLRLSADRRAVECCAEGPRPVARHGTGSAIGVVVGGGGGVGGGLAAHGRWHQATSRQSRGGNIARRGAAPPVRSRDFLTVLGDRAIPAGQRCYWEVSVNRAGDFRVGVSLAGPRPGGRRAPPPPPPLGPLRRRKRAPQRGGFDEEDDDNDGGSEDDHDDDGDLHDVDEEGLQWTLVLLGAERLFAVHGATRERVFLPALAAGTQRLGRVGVMSDGGRGVLAFYDASAGGDKRHLHTFRPGRGLLARPLYPLLALRAGRLTVVSGLEVPPRLVWRAAQRQRCA